MQFSSFWGINSILRERLYKYFLKCPYSLRIRLLKYFCKMNVSSIIKLSTPKRLIFYITNRCNMACIHCFYKNKINKELNCELKLKEIKKIALSLKHPINLLLLAGGEPLLRADIVDICKIFEINNKLRKITLSTNGFLPELIEKKIKDILKKTKLNINIQISIDGMEEVHEKIRGAKGAFSQAVKTVVRLRELQNKYPRLNEVWVVTTILNKNIKQIKPLIDFVQNELKVSHKFQLLRPCPNNGKFNNFCFLPTNKDLEQIYKMIIFSGLRKNTLLARYHSLVLRCSLDILKKNKRILNCLAGKIDGVIYPNGDVALCETTRSFANLRDWDFDFYELWNSDLANHMRNRINDCFCINPCNLATSLPFDANLLSKLCEAK